LQTERDLKKDLINKYSRGSSTIQANIYLNSRITKISNLTAQATGNKFRNFKPYDYQVRRASDVGMTNGKLDINEF